MKIIENKYNFVSGLKQRTSTKRIVIHHSASDDVSAQTIHQWHLNNKWAGIGYHFVIRKNGTIERGRPEDTVGSHAGANGNGDSIGICLTGNFMNHLPTDEQMKSLVWLIGIYIKGKYGKLNILGHKNVMATSCPGDLFPWDELNKELNKEELIDMAIEKWMEDAGISALKDLNKHGIILNPEDWSKKLDQKPDNWLLFVMMQRLANKVVK